MDSSGCGCGLMVGSTAHCSEFSASINGEKFLDKVSKCSASKKKMSHETATRVDIFILPAFKAGMEYIIRECTVFIMRRKSGVCL